MVISKGMALPHHASQNARNRVHRVSSACVTLKFQGNIVTTGELAKSLARYTTPWLLTERRNSKIGCNVKLSDFPKPHSGHILVQLECDWTTVAVFQYSFRDPAFFRTATQNSKSTITCSTRNRCGFKMPHLVQNSRIRRHGCQSAGKLK